MKERLEKRKPEGFLDYLSLAVTTFGVGYIPIAPGTWGSALGVLIYLGFDWGRAVWEYHFAPAHGLSAGHAAAVTFAIVAILLTSFSLFGVWAAGHSAAILGSTDPSEAVVDEIIGQLVTFLFIPFGAIWPLVLAGFLLFRVFDIWKPYPVDDLQGLPAGIGICADDILAGVYAGVCLSVIHVITFSL